MIRTKIGRGNSDNTETAFEEAVKEFVTPKLILYCTSEGKFKEFSKLLSEKFPNAIVMGSSAYREICKYGLTNGALLAMSFEDGIECVAGVIEDVDKYPVKYIERMQKCLSKFKDYSNMVCLEFCNGVTNGEEKVIATMNSMLRSYDIPLMGGTSADDGEFRTTYVGLNGQVYDNHCVFVLIKNLGGKIKLYQENIFKKTEHSFVATKVDVKQRIVHELDEKPCAEMMAKALGVSVSKLDTLFGTHPLGRIVGENIYISANKNIINQKSVSFYSRIYKNTQVVLMEPDDYKTALHTTLSNIKSDFNHISCMVVINCVSRTVLFEQEGFADSFAGQVGSVGDYIGFACFGEQMDEYHVNQSMVIGVFE